MLPVIARLFEKLVFDQLYQYLDENGFLSPDQSGSRALHSAVTSLLKCTVGKSTSGQFLLVSRAVGFLKYSKRYFPITAVKTLYTSIVEPHFQYCCSVWGCCNAAEIQHLQRLQNRAAMIVTNSSFDAAIKPMFESLGWKTIKQLINTQSKIVTFKSLRNFAPRYLCELFNKNSSCSSRNLHNTNTDVRLPKKNTTQGQKAFSFRGAKIWNSHSTETKLALPVPIKNWGR